MINSLPALAMSFPDIDPIAIQIGPLAIRWYALAYIVGLLLGLLYCRRLSHRSPAKISAEAFDDLFFWAALGVILGGRLGYVLFYKPKSFLADPIQILKVWEGGMSFHGGMLGVLLAMILFSRYRKLDTLAVGDIVSAAAPIGLFFGRIANFVNGELFGRPSDVPWAMVFPHGGPLPRHPSQLYEAALEGLLLFVLLHVLIRFGALGHRGLIAGLFLVGYGLSRLIVEFFRQPDEHLGFLFQFVTMGQLLSLPMVAAGLALAIYAWTAKPKPNQHEASGNAAS